MQGEEGTQDMGQERRDMEMDMKCVYFTRMQGLRKRNKALTQWGGGGV